MAKSVSQTRQLSKATANYRKAEIPQLSCNTCAFFRLGILRRGSCVLVSGSIQKEWTCDLWRPGEYKADLVPPEFRERGGIRRG